MNTTNIRAALKLNAAAITRMQNDVKTYRAAAFSARAINLTDAAKVYSKYAFKLRKKIAAAVALQRSYKVELQYNQRAERIEAKFQLAFGRPTEKPQFTSHELEAQLDALLAEREHVAVFAEGVILKTIAAKA